MGVNPMGTQAFNPDEQYRKVAREWFKNRAPDRISVPQDWADDLIKGAAAWVYKNEIPTWLLKKPLFALGRKSFPRSRSIVM